MRGRVVEFDAHRGYGTIHGEDGGQHFFHCTQLLDGTRVIDTGTEVEYEVIPGHGGRWEAAGIIKLKGAT